ncbi:MAG: HU family DNA-binding protein [Myxococcota bacterium]
MEELAASLGITRKLAQQVVRGFFGIVTEKVRSGRDVMVPQFGVFATKTRKARRVRDVATGQWLDLPATESLTIRPSAHLRGIVK